MRTIAWLPVLLSSSAFLLSSCADDVPGVPVPGDSSGTEGSGTTSTVDPDSTGTTSTVDPDSTGTTATVDPDSTGTGSSTTSTDPDSTGPVMECGDGAITDDEACDDGNTDDDDGCSSTCEVESGFDCTDEPSTCMPICGDGLVVGDEPCDDANFDVGDGCDDACMVESGWACDGEPSVCMTGCGDGIIAGMEECDDANMDDADGCSAACDVEPGFECMGEPSVCAPVCGDGLVGGTETCDDANVEDGDGCSATCQAEPGYGCMGEPSVCAPVCGDGLVLAPEVCDDADTDDGDGCSSTCTPEPGWQCMGEPSVCDATCGDGMIVGPETCDDADTDDGDGCSSTCQIEPGWQCLGEPSVCTAECGDGLLGPGEQCDDGNWAQGDGCDTLCNEEFGWGCVGEPSVCSEVDTVASVALGAFGGCVLTALGEVGCFGSNTQGEAGNGTSNIETHLPVPSLDDAIAVAAGEQFHCAIRSAGDVWCWGDNSQAQMGPLSTPPNDEALPIHVVGLPPVAAIDLGDDHACVIDGTGVVWCWGDNVGRQLGRGGTTTVDDPIPTPVPMPGGLAAIDLGLGDDHSCAVLSDGTVACWGDDDNGQLGDGVAGTDSGDATLVVGLSGVVDVEGGQDHTCAVTDLDELYCWGQNADGQLGNGTLVNEATPQLVSLPSTIDAITLGDNFACALLQSDQVYCWGEGDDFQLGSLDVFNLTSPAEVLGLPAGDLVDIEAGGRGVCVLSATGERSCWGYSQDGQLGFAPLAALEPTPVLFSGPVAEVTLDRAEYRGVMCGVLLDGTVECAGDGTLVARGPTSGAQGYFEPMSYHLALPTTLPLIADVQTMRMGEGFACAATGVDVQCWGDNSQRQLGQGAAAGVTDIITPVPVMNLGAVDELELGSDFACVRVGGTVQCWGNNTDYECGEPATNADQPLPVTVMNIADAIDISTGEFHACALRATGVVSCWGNDDSGQLGDNDGDPNDSAIPVDVTGLPGGVTQIDGGQDHTCALAGGEVYCWGEAQYGNLGQGNETDSDTALLVPGLTDVVQIASGWNYVCARDAAGDVWCWGYALEGHLGDGGPAITGLGEVHSPAPFVVASGVTDLVAGNAETCIETMTGWSCLGLRAAGQLGDGTTEEPVMPMPTVFGQ